MVRRSTDSSVARIRQMDDADLVKQAQKDLPYDMRAYEELMMRNERVLYAVCLRTFGNTADAEDVTQDVMLKVFTSIKTFKGESTFKTWLLRIATNACTDRIKKQAVANRYKESLRNEPIEYAEPPNEDSKVLSLLKQVSPDDRQVLALRYVADLSLQEVADATGLSLSAAKMRLYRATEKLRELVQKDEQYSQ